MPDEVVVELKGPSNTQIAAMRIVASNPSLIKVLSGAEADSSGQERIQLLENTAYEFSIEPKPENFDVLEDGVLTKSRLQSTNAIRGTINSKSYAGRFAIRLVGRAQQVIEACALEFVPKKFSHLADFQDMLDEIASFSLDLVTELKSPVHCRLVTDPRVSADSIQQRFFYVKALISSANLVDAVNQVIRSPHSLLIEEQVEANINRPNRFGRLAQKQLAMGTKRARLPLNHPLRQTMLKQGIKDPSVPSKINVIQKKISLDTPENRFIKFVLQAFRDFFDDIELRMASNAAWTKGFIRREVRPAREQLDEILNRDFFKPISKLAGMPLSSPVLQRKAGYRELLQGWLRFELACRLSWDGGMDVFQGNSRDVATLYEYWVCLKLLSLFSFKFGLALPLSATLLEKTNDGMELNLKRGRNLNVLAEFRHSEKGLLNLRFSFNRVFSGVRMNSTLSYPEPGSWTRELRPDITLSIWPKGVSEKDAELREMIIHLHFDAKYRVERIEDLFGQENIDLDTDREAESLGQYKRADLLKMHAYKDAIRRSAGAYVVYPGDKETVWCQFNEVVPSLGAFPLRPGNHGDEDINRISEFLDSIIDNFLDSSSQRAKFSQASHSIHGTLGDRDWH